MVSEFMLQQTPVARVLPVYDAWLLRWPSPAALAAETPGEAVRMWGRLGYPRRALRLHASATAIVELHAGEVPTELADLQALPGVGDYTARAIAAFAHRRSHAVLDTNVRRVLARAWTGVEHPPRSLRVDEVRRAEDLLPADPDQAATWSVALMELGALVCTAKSPRCSTCPLAADCAWRAAGSPPYDGPTRRAQAWAGTDRQCRGLLLGVVRDADGPVHRARLDAQWSDEQQRTRCLDSLLDDGLLVRPAPDLFALP